MEQFGQDRSLATREALAFTVFAQRLKLLGSFRG